MKDEIMIRIPVRELVEKMNRGHDNIDALNHVIEMINEKLPSDLKIIVLDYEDLDENEILSADEKDCEYDFWRLQKVNNE